MEKLCQRLKWIIPQSSVCERTCDLHLTKECLLTEKNKTTVILKKQQAMFGLTKAFTQMLAFHKKQDCYTGTTPKIPTDDVVALRLDLFDEEADELHNAIVANDLAKIADGCADLIYVTIGLCVCYGLYLPDIWETVHNKNMSKTGGTKDQMAKS